MQYHRLQRPDEHDANSVYVPPSGVHPRPRRLRPKSTQAPTAIPSIPAGIGVSPKPTVHPDFEVLAPPSVDPAEAPDPPVLPLAALPDPLRVGPPIEAPVLLLEPVPGPPVTVPLIATVLPLVA
jgi:hypothetical protein